jgi:putative transposase
MSESNLLRSLGQVSSDQVGEVFREYLRGSVRQMIVDAMADEVSELCGRKYDPSDTDHYRAGSAPGQVLHEGRQIRVSRPRVRRRDEDGSSSEIALETYLAARDPRQLRDSILQALMAGVSTRDIEKLHTQSPGVKRSNVSRHWQEAGHEFTNRLRDRDLKRQDWLVLMLDGLQLSRDQTAIVALGVTTGGDKHILDFELGSSENNEVCQDLMKRLHQRGFCCRRRLLVVLDGSQPLRRAVKTFFPDAVIQRCLVHKERNLQGRLSKRHWGELARLFKRLRQVQGPSAAMEVIAELKRFLRTKNAEALASLEEAGEELIALHLLNVPNTLHRNLLSTNAIENSLRNTRRKLGRVSRFRPETDQAQRWLAFALTDIESGFRKLSGHKDLHKLVEALEREPAPDDARFDQGSPPSPTAQSSNPEAQQIET